MNRFMQIASALTILTAVLGLLVGFQVVSWHWVAVAGVLAGLWWAFGRRLLPQDWAEREQYRAQRSERR